MYGHILTQKEFSVRTKLVVDIYRAIKLALFKALRDEIPQKEKLVKEIKLKKQNSVNSHERGLDGVRRNRDKLN